MAGCADIAERWNKSIQDKKNEDPLKRWADKLPYFEQQIYREIERSIKNGESSRRVEIKYVKNWESHCSEIVAKYIHNNSELRSLCDKVYAPQISPQGRIKKSYIGVYLSPEPSSWDGSVYYANPTFSRVQKPRIPIEITFDPTTKLLTSVTV